MSVLPPAAKKIGLIDYPNERKQHEFEVPLLGGLAITLAVVVGALLLESPVGQYRFLFLSILLIAAIGLLDDIRELTPRVRLIGQIVAASLIVFVDQKVVHSLGEILFIAQSYGLGFLASLFSIVAIVGTINAFNMIDGHDGLAGLCGALSLTAVVTFSVIDGDLEAARVMALFLVGALTFLIFNLPFLVGRSRQIFLGDSGSMLIGLVLAYFLIDQSQSGNHSVRTTAAPWIIGLPLLDMLSVMTLRVFGRRSPFAADRLHIHHLLIDFGLKKYSVLVMLICVQVVFTGVGVFGTLFEWQDGILFWAMFLVLGMYLGLNRALKRIIQRRSVIACEN
jgi:UDP-GlcNAc:undecaprenyl-phosphate GlcNAc-1-phosphate transferase